MANSGTPMGAKYLLLPSVSARLTAGAVEREEGPHIRRRADNPEAALLEHDSYLHEGQIEEEGWETTECRTHHEATSVPGNDRARPQNE